MRTDVNGNQMLRKLKDADNVIEIKNLVVNINGNRILDGLDLNVRQGEILGVIGPNGSGKTTLLKTLAGILNPETGVIAVFGKKKASWNKLELACKVAYLPQDYQCYWNFTVENVINLGASRGKGFIGWASLASIHRKNQQSLYRNLELDHLQDRTIRTLSGGEKARVMLASVLAGKPQLLLADEPSASLDITHQHRMMKLMRDLTKKTNMTTVVVLHDLNLAAYYTDRLALINRGKCVSLMQTKEMMASCKLDEVYHIHFQRFFYGETVYVLPKHGPKDLIS